MNKIERRSSDYLKRVITNIDPVEKEVASQRVAMAVRISEALEVKGMSKSEFATLMGKHPSEITKWLSGRHNFTFDTLCAIQMKLDVQLLVTEEPSIHQAQEQRLVATLIIQQAPSKLEHSWSGLLVQSENRLSIHKA